MLEMDKSIYRALGGRFRRSRVDFESRVSMASEFLCTIRSSTARASGVPTRSGAAMARKTSGGATGPLAAGMPFGPEERAKYLSSPEVWSEITSVYDEYLKHYPSNHAARSKYASLAFNAAHDPEAHAQFEALGDRLATWSYQSLPLEALKRMRDQAARVVAGRPREGDAPARNSGRPD
jgi:hypothetical protein